MKQTPLLRLGQAFVLGVLTLASCQVAKEIDVIERVSYDLTLNASLPQTRTANDGANTLWVADDALTVLHSAAGDTQFYGSRFYYSGESNAFSGKVREVSAVNDWYMLYPYREDNVDAREMHVSIANVTVQNGNDNMVHVAGEGIPLWGRELNVERSTALSVTMKNVLAVHKFSVYNDTEEPIVVKEITLAVPVPATGSYVGDLTADEVEWVPDGSTSKNVTVQVADGEEIQPGDQGYFYAATVPFSLTAGSKMHVQVTAVHPSNPSQEIQFFEVNTLKSDKSMTAGTIKPFPIVFDEEHQTDTDPDAPVIKTDQTLTFATSSVTWTLGDVYALNGIYDLPMEVNGAHTDVTYSSSNASVATITSEGKVKIAGTGSTTIKAVAVETAEYNSAEAQFTLVIAEAAVVPSERKYTFVSPTSLSEGTYLIAGSESNELSVALFPTVATKSWSSSQTGSVTDGQYIPHKVVGTNNSVNSITTEDAEVIGSEVKLVASGSAWKIQVVATGEYLLAPSQEYRIQYTTESSATAFSIGTGTNGAQVRTGSNSGNYFYHSGSAGGFTLRSTSTANTRFYKLDSSKQSQSIAFDQSTVTWTLGDAYKVGESYTFAPVSGAVTTVTYTSSDPSVASIADATVNKVTIHKAGSVTITATAAETATYYGATATMTLTIKEASTTPVGTGVYELVEEELPDWTGTYLFVDKNSSKAFAAFSDAANYAVSVTVNNKQIVSDGTVDKYALTVTNSGKEHANASGQTAYDVKNSDGKYIYYSSSAIQIMDTNEKEQSSYGLVRYSHALKYYNDEGVQVLSSGEYSGFNKYYLGYSGSAFGYSSSSATSRRVQLYKLNGSATPGKYNQTLTFANPSVTWPLGSVYEIGGSYPIQTLSGAQTTVTYGSTVPSVATISNGQILIVGTGTTTITATAAASDTYNAGSASYTLTITDGSSTGTAVYRKVTQEPASWDGTYLFVDETSKKAFAAFSDVSGYAVSVTVNGDYTIASDGAVDKYALTIADAGANHGNSNASGLRAYNVKNSEGKFIYASSGEVQIKDSNTSSSSSTWGGSTSYTYYHAFKYDGADISANGVMVMSANNSSGGYAYYLGYASSAFGYSRDSGSDSRRLSLYKLENGGGTTPSTKINQNLTFAKSTVTLTVGTDCEIGGTYPLQSVSGAQTTVTYGSTVPSVATVSNGQLQIVGTGTTTITATAAANDTYNAGSASYTLTIQNGGSQQETGTKTYEYVTSISAGTYIIAGTESGSNVLYIARMPNVQSGTWTSQYDNSTVNGKYVPQLSYGTSSSVSTITADATANADIIASEVEIISAGTNTWKIKAKDGTYLQLPAENYNLAFVSESSASSLTISSSSINTNGYYFYHSSGATGFTSRNTTTTSNLRFYKLNTSGGTTPTPGKQDQTFSFGQSSVTWTLGNGYSVGGSYPMQTLTGTTYGTVTYSSSDPSVATISNGQIQILKEGSTRITVTAAGDDTYNEHSAYYTLVIRSAQQGNVYSLENDNVAQYFDKVASEPYDPNDYSYSHLIDRNNVSTKYFYNTTGQNNRLDWPKPVPVSWTNPSSNNGSKVVYIYNDSAMTDEELHVDVSSSSSNSADVYNLIPGRTYWYKVTNNGSQLATGSFQTTGRRRMMKIGTSQEYGQSYANNCRDLGGQVTTSGKTIKYGILYRGSNMDNTTTDQKNTLLNYMKIRVDVDLRESSGRNPLNNNNYGISVTVSDQNYNSMQNLTDPDRMGKTLNDIMKAVADGKNCYIHCAVGADRTGFVCMVLEGILGVPQQRCDIDYELTSFAGAVGLRARKESSGNSWYGGGDGNVNYYYSGSGKGVTYINANYSGNSFQEKVINFAKAMGVSESTITAFQNNMLE